LQGLQFQKATKAEREGCTMTKTLVEQYVEDPAHMRLFQQERAIYEVTELLESVMEDKGVSRSELARLLGKDKSWVTQLLDGEANKTIRTVADVLAVLGREFRAFSDPIRISNDWQCATTISEVAASWESPWPHHLKVAG